MLAPNTLIEQRTFSTNDQDSFARLSGDFNPLHTDPLAARRLLFGHTIAHGAHVLLWALCSTREVREPAGCLDGLTVQFRRPIPVGATASLILVRQDSRELKLRVETESGLAAVVTAQFRNTESHRPNTVPNLLEPNEHPTELGAHEIAGSHGRLPLGFDADLAGLLLPGWDALLTPVQLAQLLASSRLVGMRCPGLHSIFGELSVRFKEGGAEPPEYRVVDWDPRFSRASIQLSSSSLEARVVAFLRPPPQDQARSLDLVEVRPAEFAAQTALVVGGSRGLGETCAKLLAAGGAAVTLTYSQGEADALRVVQDISAAGGDARAEQLDVLDPSSVGRLSRTAAPTHLYYFASPFVFGGVAGRFSAGLFHQFCEFYVTGLEHLVASLRSRSDSLSVLFNPSSVAIDEASPAMSEYAAAKSASEMLCRSLARSHAGLKAHSIRLPRLATDQTRTLLAFESAEPPPVLLAELRRLEAH